MGGVRSVRGVESGCGSLDDGVNGSDWGVGAVMELGVVEWWMELAAVYRVGTVRELRVMGGG